MMTTKMEHLIKFGARKRYIFLCRSMPLIFFSLNQVPKVKIEKKSEISQKGKDKLLTHQVRNSAIILKISKIPMPILEKNTRIILPCTSFKRRVKFFKCELLETFLVLRPSSRDFLTPRTYWLSGF